MGTHFFQRSPMHPDQDPRREPIAPFPYKTAAMLVFSALLVAGCSGEVQGRETPEVQFTEPRVTFAAVSATDFLNETPHASATPVPSKTWTLAPTETPTEEQILPTPTETEQVREIGILCKKQYQCDLVTDEMKEPLSPEQITRLVDGDGNPLPFGYLEGEDLTGNGKTYKLFSGIVRGFVMDAEMAKYNWGWIIMEIPYENGSSQYLLWGTGYQIEQVPSSNFVLPDGNISEQRRIPVSLGFSYWDLRDMFADPRMLGQQIIIGVEFQNRELPEDFVEAHDEAFQDIMDEEVVNVGVLPIRKTVHFDQGVFEEITGLKFP